MKVKTLIIMGILLGAAGAATLVTAQEQETAPAPAAQAALVVEEAVICTGVVDRVPQGAAESFLADVGALYCFTKVSGAAEPTSIKHLWYHGETLANTVELAVGGSPWRTWSTKTIPADMTGAWKVEIQGPDGALLKTLNFTIQ